MLHAVARSVSAGRRILLAPPCRGFCWTVERDRGQQLYGRLGEESPRRQGMAGYLKQGVCAIVGPGSQGEEGGAGAEEEARAAARHRLCIWRQRLRPPLHQHAGVQRTRAELLCSLCQVCAISLQRHTRVAVPLPVDAWEAAAVLAWACLLGLCLCLKKALSAVAWH